MNKALTQFLKRDLGTKGVPETYASCLGIYMHKVLTDQALYLLQVAELERPLELR